MTGQQPSRSPGMGTGAVIAVLAAVAVASALLLGLLGGAIGLRAASLTRLPERPTPASAVAADDVSPSPAPERTGPATVADVVREVMPSVVTVIVDAGMESGSGSGFVLSDGYVVTNNHVIDAALADDGTIEVIRSDGSRVPAEAVGRNVSYDVAVLKVEADDLDPLPAQTKDVKVGDSVIVIGAPLGLDFTVTTGIVSALNRPVTIGEAQEASFVSAVQTDAPINPGNSGGPVVDSSGRFIGMASSIITLGQGSAARSIGLGFAIPARAVVRIAEEIIATGSSRTPVIGVTLDPSFAGPGALIDTIVPDGAAAKAGLRAGDVISEIGGLPVADANELVVAIRDRLPGEEVRVVARRGDTVLEVNVVLGSREDR